MADVTITVRDNGPYRVRGNLRVFDASGNELQTEAKHDAIALCRCGNSSTKPFCDGTHRTAGFDSVVRAATPE